MSCGSQYLALACSIESSAWLTNQSIIIFRIQVIRSLCTQRTVNISLVYLWYPLNIVSGGTTAKVIVAAKDTFVGKYIYKDTISRNLAAVIYRDEKEMQTMAMKQFRVLRSATEFKYGYKLIENNSLSAALAANDVIELPSQTELKTVFDKVKDFFGDAKESFGKMTFLNSGTESSEGDTKN